MSFLTNFKISTRLTFSFSCILLLLIVISVLAVISLQRTSNFSDKLVSEDLSQNTIASNIQNLAQSASISLLLILNTKEREDRIKLYKEMDITNAKLDQILNTLIEKRQSINSIDALNDLNNIVQLRKQYKKEFLATVDFVEWAPGDAIEHFNEKTRPALILLLGEISRYLSQQNDLTFAKANQVKDNNRETILLMQGLSLGAVLLGIILAVVISRSIVTPLQKAIDAMYNIVEGDGDLSKRLAEKGSDELSTLGKGFNSFAANIETIIVQLSATIKEISQSSSQSNQTALLTGEAILEQKGDIQTLFDAMERVAPAMLDIADLAKSGLNESGLSQDNAADGITAVEAAVERINSLDKDMDNSSDVINALVADINSITSVLDVIGAVASQTNLLALNASIEAARAGDQGRGFAVVADEVRSLASRTQNATKEIREMTEALQQSAYEAVNVMQGSKEKTQKSVQSTKYLGELLGSILTGATSITQMNKRISDATKEQSETISELRLSVDKMHDSVESISDGAQQNAVNSSNTKQLIGEIQDLVNCFKTDQS